MPREVRSVKQPDPNGWKLLVVAIAILLYGTYALTVGSFATPSKRGRTTVVGTSTVSARSHTFSGVKARGMGLATALLGVGLLLLREGERRSNERLTYGAIGSMGLSLLLFLVSLVYFPG